MMPALVAELARRAGDLSVTAITADAREFDLGRRFALCIVPMQTIQLLGGADGRRAFLECARRHLQPGGLLAVAIAPELDLFEVVDGGPTPAARHPRGRRGRVLEPADRGARRREGFVLERRRERISASAIAIGRAGRDPARPPDRAASSSPRRRPQGCIRPGAPRVAATDDYVGSEVVLLRA